MSNIIQELESEQMGRQIPEFSPGDTLVVQVRVKEANRERLQAFEGIVIAKRNRGLNSAFTVRKISHGEGVERVFQTHSPSIAEVKVVRRGDVRRAKLYYLRERTGKAARIKEKISVGGTAKTKKSDKKTTAEAPAGDDLTKIEGIGPKIAEALTNAGVASYAALADSNADQLKEIMTEASSTLASKNPGTWPKQAEMARDGKWDELKVWQDELDGGVEK